MRRADGASVYDAVHQFVEWALVTDGSLFTPGRAVWSLAAIEDLHRRFNLQPDTSSDRFDVKLRRQLNGAADSTIQFTAEALYIHLLIVDDIGGTAKRRLLSAVLSWMREPVPVPPELDEALDHGFVGGGLAFKTLRPSQLRFLVEFARLWKGLTDDSRRGALADPWKFKQVLWEVPIQSGFAQREALLHLVFPDTFEDMIAREHKSRIAESFAEYVTEPSDDVDRRLLQVRQRAQERFGGGFSFYDPEVRPLWDPVAEDARLWDEFLKWGVKFQAEPNFGTDEREYKLRLAAQLRVAVEALAKGRDWIDALVSAFGSSENNLTRWQANQPFLAWCREHSEEAATALRGLWAPRAHLRERLRAFLDGVPDDLLSGSDLLRVLALLLLGANPEEWPPMTAGALAKACKLTGYPPPSPGSDEGQRYRYALTFLDRLIKEGAGRGVQLQDHLEAQGLMWAVTEWEVPDGWTDDEKAAVLAWRGGRPAAVGPVPAGARSLQQLADELFMPLDFITDVVDLLRARKQIILYGPPGTGKTYLARKLADHLAPDPERRDLVQFHPSYSYEDFVEGYRPEEKDGVLSYKLKPGPLLRLAGRAEGRAEDYVLVIDEINRGNLPRILGELLYALEYRGQPVTLMYRELPMSLPPNLLVIGTMNTADRSVGLIDAALRRRFHFVRMFPDEGPLAGLLRSWLDKNNPEMIATADIVDRLNAKLRETVGPHLQVGYSHFLREDLSQEVLAKIWDNDIMPLLEDQFFGREDELKAFSLERLREGRSEDDQASGTGIEDSPALQS